MPNVDHGPVTLDDLEGRTFARVWEVAAILGCDRRTVRSAIRLGEIPHAKAGNEYRIPLAWLRRAASGEIESARAAV